MLTKRQATHKTLLCVGLDPLLDRVPDDIMINNRRGKVLEHMKRVVDQTAPYACMFKPNVAFWEAIFRGHDLLKLLVNYIHEKYSDIPVLIDAKRGDIGKTQKQYAIAHLTASGHNGDGMTFSPYMGKDTMSGLVCPDTVGKALVGLCYTSNPTAREVQDVILEKYGYPLWVVMAQLIYAWARSLDVLSDAGLVVAAAYNDASGAPRANHFSILREKIDNHMWFLTPGIDAQGGLVEATVCAGWAGYGSIAINSSSGIIFADDPAMAARNLRDEINSAIPH